MCTAGMGAWCNALSRTVRGWHLCKKGNPTLSAPNAAMSGVGSAKGTGTQAKGKTLPLISKSPLKIAFQVVGKKVSALYPNTPTPMYCLKP